MIRPPGSRLRPAAALAVLLGLAGVPLPSRGSAAPARRAPTSEAAPAAAVRSYPAGASVQPDSVSLAQPVRYRAWVAIAHEDRAQWVPPDSVGTLSWGKPAARRVAGDQGTDTLVFESQLQIFATGPVTIDGPRVQFRGGTDANAYRLPPVAVAVMPSPGVADSNAQLHPPRGPLRAPWWERVPWTLVVIAAALIVALAVALRWLRRRRARPVVAPLAATRPARDPAETALTELESLRRLELPEQGRYAEHAFLLTAIARRFLEATAGTPRPGDTTPELVSHPEAARLESGQLARLSTLLGWWDRVKFAREPATVEEARRGEQAVEELAWRRLEERERQRQSEAAASAKRVA